ncbi:MAG: hypothetical protein PHO08_16485 [Methylococcales bacterium]|nr:hypothetical protein [Methylococcales bacterium]MDD5633226.1 hypothetical protein [Methylococcales bacterium]
MYSAQREAADILKLTIKIPLLIIFYLFINGTESRIGKNFQHLSQRSFKFFPANLRLVTRKNQDEAKLNHRELQTWAILRDNVYIKYDLTDLSIDPVTRHTLN